MAMLDGLRNVFMQSLKFCRSKVAYDILIEKWNKECEEVYKYKQSLIAEERAKHQPTADVVEVVRCCDCKHIAIINNSKLYAKCEKTNYEFNPFETDTRSHFCSYGERRAEE